MGLGGGEVVGGGRVGWVEMLLMLPLDFVFLGFSVLFVAFAYSVPPLRLCARFLFLLLFFKFLNFFFFYYFFLFFYSFFLLFFLFFFLLETIFFINVHFFSSLFN